MRVLKYLRFTHDYGYTIQDILLYLKVTVMKIGYQMLNTPNPIIVMCLPLGGGGSSLMKILKTNGDCHIHYGI